MPNLLRNSGRHAACAGYLPYRKNYEDWGEAVAHLSRQYPVVLAWAVDDFAYAGNLSLFTPAYLQRVRDAVRAIQPTLEFYPVVYHQYMESLIMPFRDGLYRNTAWRANLQEHLNSAASLLASRGRKLILMVYALNLSNTEITPDVDYVRALTLVGMDYLRQGRIGGVVHYGLDLRPGRPQRGDWNYSHGSGRGALAFVLHPESTTSAGDYAAATTTIRLNAGSGSTMSRPSAAR